MSGSGDWKIPPVQSYERFFCLPPGFGQVPGPQLSLPRYCGDSILLQPIMILSYLGLPHPAMVSHLLAIIGSQMLDTANPPPR